MYTYTRLPKSGGRRKRILTAQKNTCRFWQRNGLLNAQSRRKLFSLKTPVFYFSIREESLLKEIKEEVLPSTNLGKKTICKKLKEGQKGF